MAGPVQINQATTIVCRAALGYANGSPNAKEIGEAVAFLRAYIADMEEPARAGEDKDKCDET